MKLLTGKVGVRTVRTVRKISKILALELFAQNELVFVWCSFKMNKKSFGKFQSLTKSHVKHMHANSLLNSPWFLFEINNHATQFFPKPSFDSLSNWSKTHFWSSSNQWRWIKSGLSNDLSITWPWIVQKLTINPPSLVRTGSKMSFRTI